MKCCDMKIPQRKPTRLDGFDYSSPGAYFVTICTKDKKCLLSEIVGEGLCPLPENRLTPIGEEIKSSIRFINDNYPGVTINRYVIMPNHIHLIVIIETGGDGTPPLQDIIGRLKSYTTVKYGAELFQRSFHDHIIRGEKDYIKIAEYIDTNPLKWESDCFYEKTRQ